MVIINRKHRMKKLFTTAYFVLMVNLLSGCISPYQSVTSGPTADVSFSAKTLPDTGVILTGITSLYFYIHKCSTEWYGRVKYTEEGNNTYSFKAGTPLYINVSYHQNQGASSRSGQMYLSFIPEDGEKYLVEFEGLGDKFKVNVFDIRENGSGRIPVDYKRGMEHWEDCVVK